MTDRHNEHQKEYFSERSLPRMRASLSGTPYVRRHVEEVMRIAVASKGDRVIDLGCGLGKYTAAIHELGFAVEGLDLTPALIDQFRLDLPQIPAHVGDAASPPEELHGRFDLAVGFFFMHHVADLAPILEGARTLLGPGGRAVFLEPNPLFLGYYLQVTFTRGMTWRGERGILRMRPRAFEEAGRAAGFTSFGHRAFGVMPPAVANRRWGRSVERAIERVPGWQRVGAFRLFWMACPR